MSGNDLLCLLLGLVGADDDNDLELDGIVAVVVVYPMFVMALKRPMED